MSDRNDSTGWAKNATRGDMPGFTAGWILWDVGEAHKRHRRRDRKLLDLLPEKGDWKLVTFAATPRAPVRFTDRAALLAAVDGLDYAEEASDLEAVRAVLPEDGLPRLLFAPVGKDKAPGRLTRMLSRVTARRARGLFADGLPEIEPCCDRMMSTGSCCRRVEMAATGCADGGLPGNRSSADDGAMGYERYAGFHENGFTRVSGNPLSTFGLDVDTASYATMRRYVMNEKRLPPKDAVRLEEFVNYFSYSYPEPTGDVPLAVNCELADCPWEKSHRLLRVGVQACRLPTEKVPPANLVLLLDVSGSMADEFDMLKRAVGLLVDRLRDDDHISIVTYAGDAKLHLASTAGRERGRIRAAVETLACGGWTRGGAGIRLAYDQAKINFSPDANNRVVMISDGDFNVGPHGPDETERLVRAERGNGIFLTVLGVGRGNYQDDTMKRLSTAGKGNYAYLDNLLEAKKVLVNEFGATMLTVAKDVKLQLEFNPAQVASYRLLGYECRRLEAQDFADDKKDGGETGSGHSMTAFYELVPADGKVEPKADELRYQKRVPVTSDELLTVKLRYKEPLGETSRLVEIPVRAADIECADGPSEDFRFASAVAEFALLASCSEFKAGASYEALLARAREARGADRDGLRAEFVRLAEMAQMLLS